MSDQKAKALEGVRIIFVSRRLKLPASEVLLKVLGLNGLNRTRGAR